MIKNINRILVIRTDRIGDVVLTTPAIQALRLAYPNAYIAVLVSPLTVDLLKNNPLINDVLVDDRQGEHAGFSGFLRLIEMIRGKQFDLVINFHTKRRTNLLCFFSGISRRVGYKNDKYGFLLNHPLKDTRHLGEKHEAAYCMDVIESLDIKVGALQPSLILEKAWREWAEDYLVRHKVDPKKLLIAVHLGASDPAKCWPIVRFAELINKINERYNIQVILVGAKSVETLAKELLSKIQLPVLNAVGQTSLGQLAALFEKCTLVISNDSGPVHMADAVGTKVVSIFTRNQPGINPERWRPLNPNSKVVSVAPDQSISFQKAGEPGGKYLELIDTQQVFDSVDAILKLC